MTNYNSFAKFYDAVMGNRSLEYKIVKDLILKYHQKSEKVLEIGCGTGSILEKLSRKYQVCGIDISKEMLNIAKKKMPHIRLFRQDMTKFVILEKFDVILCLFDSINHLINYEDWKKVFLNTKKHLKDSGIFIFDINTEDKLMNLSKTPPIIKRFDKGYMIMDIRKEKKEITNWNIKIFERKKEDLYKLHIENIKEKSFPVERIIKTLKEIYSKIYVFDQKQKKPSKRTGRIYFVCVKK
ncbi:class I SAM-dependent methyltransferase [Patescibacteria group bacterium]|nr:class I SAM-dependent methyltransferase [Patescibacteria group bacterium]